jgi:hypothetical protein
MNEPFMRDTATGEGLARIEEEIGRRLNGRVRDFRLVACNNGLVLRGRSRSYHAKQLAQQAVMEIASLPILANEIEVRIELDRRCVAGESKEPWAEPLPPFFARMAEICPRDRAPGPSRERD